MGYVRTNAPVKLGGGGGGGGSGTPDLPTHLNSISANGGNNHVTLTLEYSNTDLVDGVQVNYKTGDYPTSPTDGELVTQDGAVTEIKIEGLTNSLTYYFRVFLYNEVDGVKYYQTDITNAQATCIPRAVEITGITPLVSASDHIVIVESGSGTISAPAGTKIILGSGGGNAASGTHSDGGTGGTSGYVSEITIDNDIDAQSFTAVIAASKTTKGTKLTVGDLSYDCGATTQIIQSKWGPIGGAGGNGGEGAHIYDGSDGGNGTGAGGGGGGGGRAGDPTYSRNDGKGGLGGNYDGYGNKGSNGSGGSHGNYICTVGGNGGDGGNGGYAAGAGGYGGWGYSEDDTDTYAGRPGNPGTGIIVIQWD